VVACQRRVPEENAAGSLKPFEVWLGPIPAMWGGFWNLFTIYPSAPNRSSVPSRHSGEALFSSRRVGQAGGTFQQTYVWLSSDFSPKSQRRWMTRHASVEKRFQLSLG